MQRVTRSVRIQFPPNAPLGFPIAVSHGFFALMFATSGEGMMRCGRARLPIADGSLVVTAPGEVHDTAEMTEVERWGLDFTPDVFGSEGAGWMFPRPTRPEWVVLLRRSWDDPQVITVPPEARAEWRRQSSRRC